MPNLDFDPAPVRLGERPERGRRRALVAACLGLGAGGVVLGLLGTREPAGQVQELPDGSRLELRGWTFGPNHTFIDGDYAHRQLLQGGDGWAVLGGYRATHEDRGNDLVLWFRGGEIALPGRELGTVWIDPHGCRISTGAHWFSELPHWGLCTVYRPFWDRSEIRPPERRWVDAPRITPRRGQDPLRYAIVDRTRPEPLVSFTVPGVPRVSTDTAGTPAPLPTRTTVGDTTFALKKLHHEEAGRYPLSRSALTFTYEGTGPDSRNWRPVRVQVEDGTGNELASTLTEGWTETSALCETLCRRDPAWKLSVRFARRDMRGVLPDAVRTLRNIPVPARKEEVELTQSFSTEGMGVRLETLHGNGKIESEAPGAGWDWGVLQLNVAAPEGGRIRILRVTDQKGQVVFPRGTAQGRKRDLECDLSLNDSFGDRGVMWPIAYPSGTRRLNLTFGIYRTRTAEFIVRP